MMHRAINWLRRQWLLTRLAQVHHAMGLAMLDHSYCTDAEMVQLATLERELRAQLARIPTSPAATATI